MLFPVIVHKEKRSDYGVVIPDIPGCFTAGKSLDEALRNVQEAVEVHLHGAADVPFASSADIWVKHPDFKGGSLHMVDIDLGFMKDETVRINITAKRSQLAAIDRAARAVEMDRSAYLVSAALTQSKMIGTSSRTKRK